MSDDGDSFQLDDNDDAEPITAQKVQLFSFGFFKTHLSISIIFMPANSLNSTNRCWKICKIRG